MFSAFTNPEYISIDDLQEELNNYHKNESDSNKLPPSKPPASPPKTPPKLPPRKHSKKVVHLYQNVFLNQDDVLDNDNDEPICEKNKNRHITINCNFNNKLFSNINTNNNRCEFLLKPSSQSRNSLFNKSLSSTTTLSSNSGGSSIDTSSSNATMIIRKSPVHMDYYTPILFANQNSDNDKLIEEDEQPFIENRISPCSIPPPPKSFLTLPIHSNNNKTHQQRHSFDYELNNINNNSEKTNTRRSEPPPSLLNKLSPIMTSSRADLNNLNQMEENNQNVNQKFNSLPSNYRNRMKNDEPSNEKMCTEFSNLNYYYIEPRQQPQPQPQPQLEDLEPPSTNLVEIIEEDEEEEEDILAERCENEEESINTSSLSSLVLLPPSPFKTEPQFLLLNDENDKTPLANKNSTTKKPKKVSFMINNDLIIDNNNSNTTFINLSNTSTSSNSFSPINLGQNEQLQSNDNNQLELIQEKIFSKIFSNQDYFLNAKQQMTQISTSSTSSSSSTSSTSSGYKSCSFNLTAVTNLNTNKPATELDSFIETNRDRLDRLKHKRMQLLSNLNNLKLKDMNEDFLNTIDETNNFQFQLASKKLESLSSCGSSTSSSSTSSSSSSVVISNEEETLATNLLIKSETAKLFQKLYKLNQETNSIQSPLFRSPKSRLSTPNSNSINNKISYPNSFANSLTRSIK